MLIKLIKYWNAFCWHSWQYSQPWYSYYNKNGKLKSGISNPPFNKFRGCVKCNICQKLEEHTGSYITIGNGKWR